MHRHDWIKLDAVPLYDYFDYDGWHIGVFRCKCKACGKERNRKFLDNRQPGQLI